MEEYMYIIGVGDVTDWEAGRGSLYYIEGKDGKKYLPVFTSADKATEFGSANFNTTKAHMDMLEGLAVSHVEPLTEGRFIVMPYTFEGVATWALSTDMDYFLRDPRPGREQEVLPVPKD